MHIDFSACNDLNQTADNRFPNAIVIVSTMTPPGAAWTRLAQTEIIEVVTFHLVIEQDT